MRIIMFGIATKMMKLKMKKRNVDVCCDYVPSTVRDNIEDHVYLGKDVNFIESKSGQIGR